MRRAVDASKTDIEMRPPLSPEARERQLVSLATDLAEKQLREGTASAQVICHYLKLGSSKEKLEQEILKKQKTLIEAKTDAIQSEKKMEELYADAIRSMQAYRGEKVEVDEDI